MRFFPSMPGACIIALLFPAFFVLAEQKDLSDSHRDKETIKIGFMIPMPSWQDDLSREALYGAKLAIEQANEGGGFAGHNFELVTRSTDGPWGSGSKRAVSLVYDDSVCAIVTSLDGRNAHLAEQVITKAQVALVVTRATDPTITKAYVPWVFRVIPNDEQQARVLAREIYKNRNLQHVLLLTADTYDSKSSAEGFLKTAKTQGRPEPGQILFSPNDDMKQLSGKLQDTNPEAIIIFSLPEIAGRLIKQIKLHYPNGSLFGSISLLYNTSLLQKFKNTSINIRAIIPGFFQTEKGKAFQISFVKRYGFKPGTLAANAYEGTKLIIDAVMETGADRDGIRQFLLQLKNYPGINGIYNFDDNGNMRSEPSLLKITR